MNAQFLGPWNAGPRAHPGDGLLDTYDVRLKPGQLLAVRARLPDGSHLPHPGIRERRVAARAGRARPGPAPPPRRRAGRPGPGAVGAGGAGRPGGRRLAINRPRRRARRPVTLGPWARPRRSCASPSIDNTDFDEALTALALARFLDGSQPYVACFDVERVDRASDLVPVGLGAAPGDGREVAAGAGRRRRVDGAGRAVDVGPGVAAGGGGRPRAAGEDGGRRAVAGAGGRAPARRRSRSSSGTRAGAGRRP